MKRGSINITNPKRGSTDIQKVYRGASLIYERVVSDIPIGSIEAYLKSFTNVPVIPSDYVECNGQTLDDISSPFHNTVIPDLNLTPRFLRGATASGLFAGSDITSHTHTFTPLERYGGSGQTITQNFGPTDISVVPPYYSVVWIMKIK